VGAGKGVVVAVLDYGLTNFNGSVGVRLPLSLSGLLFGTFAAPFTRNPDQDFSRVSAGAEFTPTGPWALASSGQRILFDAVDHGTHVSGTIAQWTNNSFGFASIANGATLLPVKVCYGELDWIMAWGRDSRVPLVPLENCDTAAMIQGIHYAADNGAKVLNLSIGGPSPQPALLDALRYAVSKGAFIAISAGNEALEGDPIQYPAAYAANIAGVVAVGATTPLKNSCLVLQLWNVR
jgi:subtilisin family serine protease